MDKLYRKVKCPDCEWSQFSGCIDTVGMTPCYRCQSTGFIFVPVDYTELQSEGEGVRESLYELLRPYIKDEPWKSEIVFEVTNQIIDLIYRRGKQEEEE